jgi:hypothetical protein
MKIKGGNNMAAILDKAKVKDVLKVIKKEAEEERTNEIRSLEEDIEDADFIIRAECTTDSTARSGASKGCTSVASELDAPNGHVFNDRELNIEGVGWRWIAKRGSSNHVIIEFSNYIPILEGSKDLTYPTHASFKVSARSKPGVRNVGARGVSKAVMFGKYIKYK